MAFRALCFGGQLWWRVCFAVSLHGGQFAAVSLHGGQFAAVSCRGPEGGENRFFWRSRSYVDRDLSPKKKVCALFSNQLAARGFNSFF